MQPAPVINMPTRRVLLSEKQIETRVTALAEEISKDYADKGELVMIGVLKGSFIFLADLSRRMSIPRHIEFLSVSSYSEGSTQGAVRLDMDVRQDIQDKHVLVVEDIVDTGNTLDYLLDMLRSRHPASIKTCALLHKAHMTQVDIDINYLGFTIGDEWVVGYGLDFAEQDRTLPYIGIFEPD